METVFNIIKVALFIPPVYLLLTATVPAGYHEKGSDGVYRPVRTTVVKSLTETFWR